MQVDAMGRTMLSQRIVVEQKIAELNVNFVVVRQ
jgi:hypothetical protein